MTAVQQFELVIDGQLSGGEGGQNFRSLNPATGEGWADIPIATPSDVDRAVAAARSAFEGPWGAVTATRRGELMYALASVIESHIDELAEIETRDCGKLYREAHSQISSLPRWYRFFGGYADKIDGRVPPIDFPTVLNVVTREPLGVVAAISAWNSPLMLSTWKLAPALAAGNTVVLKPSESASASALRFVQLFEDAGFPPGTVNVVSGDVKTSKALVSHRDVNLVSFTGGPETARAIARLAADNLTPTRFELGGKSANLIFPDCDLDSAVSGVVAGIFAAAGQTCVAGSRVVVIREIADRFISAVVQAVATIVVGDPRDPQTQVGPIISPRECQRIGAMVDTAVQDGARVAIGGHEPEGAAGRYFLPTVLVDVRPDMTIAQEEVFGPVLSVIVVDSEDEAVAVANGTRYSLAAGVWTRDIKRAHRVAKSLRSGTVWINMYRSMSPITPHGGSGDSGYGRENGIEAIAEFTQTKSILIELSDEARDPFVGRVN